MHITTVEDVLAWGERMRAEIRAWAQKQDPSPSPPEPAEAGRDPPATARWPRAARLARRRCMRGRHPVMDKAQLAAQRRG